MAKFYGKVGYVETKETSPGVWTPKVTERNYYGDVIRRSSNHQSSSNVNDDINISQSISIVSDPYAMDNFYAMRYVWYKNVKWKVTNVDVQFPRLVLTIGGVYNGE